MVILGLSAPYIAQAENNIMDFVGGDDFTSLKNLNNHIGFAADLTMTQNVRQSDQLNEYWTHYGLNKGQLAPSWVGISLDNFFFLQFGLNDGETENVDHYVSDDWYFGGPSNSFYLQFGDDETSLIVGKHQNLISSAARYMRSNNMYAIDRTWVDLQGKFGQENHYLQVSQPLLDGQNAFLTQLLVGDESGGIGIEVSASKDAQGHLVNQASFGLNMAISNHLTLSSVFSAQGGYIAMNPSVELMNNNTDEILNGASALLSIDYQNDILFTGYSIGAASQYDTRTGDSNEFFRSNSYIGLGDDEFNITYSIMQQNNNWSTEYLNQQVKLGIALDDHYSLNLAYNDYAIDEHNAIGSGQVFESSIRYIL